MNLLQFFKSKKNLLQIIIITLAVMALIFGVIFGIRAYQKSKLTQLAFDTFEQLKNNSGIIKLGDNNINVKEIASQNEKNVSGSFEKYIYNIEIIGTYLLDKDINLYDINLTLGLSENFDVKVNDQLRINSSGKVLPKTVYIVYDINGGKSAYAVASITKPDDYKILSNEPTKANYKFTNWQDKQNNKYDLDSIINITETDIENEKNLILSAMWEERDISSIINAPTLLGNSSWYKGTTNRSNITNISIVNNFNESTYVETWNADIEGEGKIKCYVLDGNKLVIAGDGSGKIYANEDMANFFSGPTDRFTNLVSITGLELIDTQKTLDMSYMFDNCNNLKELDLSGFNTSKVTNMKSMFEACNSLISLDISNFNTGNVTNMASMFSNCKKLGIIGIGNFNTENVTNMSSMFKNCKNAEDIDIRGFDTKNVTNMSNMFSGCSNLIGLHLDNFDTAKVTDMSIMFSGCSNLIKLDLSNFDTSNVTNMSNMFSGCRSLKNINLSNFNTNNVTNMSSMFNYCNSLQSLDISTFNTNKVEKITNMFDEMSKLEEVKLGSNFNFNGNGTTKCILPTPNPNEIEGADGNWYVSSKVKYTPENVPNNAKGTYYAVL